MTEIVANSVLPALRSPVMLRTADGLRLVGELALPESGEPVATMVCLHPLPTAGGMMDSHLFRKAAWRLPALCGIAVLRFNSRGTTSAAGTSEGAFDSGVGEGFDVAAAVEAVVNAGLPDPWIVGWSFGTDVALRHGLLPNVVGAVLISPPLRFSTDEDLDRWATDGRPLVCVVPELDDYLRPAEALTRFARVPQARVTGVPGAKHLWVGEKYARLALSEVVAAIAPAAAPVTWEWDGEMQRWNDL